MFGCLLLCFESCGSGEQGVLPPLIYRLAGIEKSLSHFEVIPDRVDIGNGVSRYSFCHIQSPQQGTHRCRPCSGYSDFPRPVFRCSYGYFPGDRQTRTFRKKCSSLIL